jgi:adenylosuccinate synthase
LRRRGFIVADLGFGDAGKGLITDHLVRTEGAALVVRYSGGAQCGHNVVTADGRHHTFAQLGAGTFVPGVRTHLSRFVVLHPGALGVEAAALAGTGVPDALARLTVDPRAVVSTPFHQAAGRLRELARGGARHGSCGVGVGETRQDQEAGQESLHAADLLGAGLEARLARLQERKRAELAALRGAAVGEAAGLEWALLDAPEVGRRWLEQLRTLLGELRLLEDRLALPTALARGPVVFEGAQGVLLDERHGFHPHTTWTDTTLAPAMALLDEAGGAEVTRVGVLRAYQVRHGPGPLPTEVPGGLGLEEPHNPAGAWQGGFRAGWLDLVLTRYALAVVGGVDRLALTHLDRVARLASPQVCDAYLGGGGELITTLPVLSAPRLEHQAQLGEALARVTPRLRPFGPGFAGQVAEALGVPVAWRGYGPRSEDVRPG